MRNALPAASFVGGSRTRGLAVRLGLTRLTSTTEGYLLLADIVALAFGGLLEFLILILFDRRDLLAVLVPQRMAGVFRLSG